MSKIKDILREEFSYVYCHNCRYDGDDCDDCRRKNIGWSVSEETVVEIEEKILKIIGEGK